MIVGQTLVATSKSGTGTTTVYTPWIASWGTSATFAWEVIAISGESATVTVKIQTKNSTDADPSTYVGSTTTQTTTGPKTVSVTNVLLELVRLEFSLSTTYSSQGVAMAHLRPLNPSWQTN